MRGSAFGEMTNAWAARILSQLTRNDARLRRFPAFHFVAFFHYRFGAGGNRQEHKRSRGGRDQGPRAGANLSSRDGGHLARVAHLGVADESFTKPTGSDVVDVELDRDKMVSRRRERPAGASQSRVEKCGDDSSVHNSHRSQMRLVDGDLEYGSAFFDIHGADFQTLEERRTDGFLFESLDDFGDPFIGVVQPRTCSFSFKETQPRSAIESVRLQFYQSRRPMGRTIVYSIWRLTLRPIRVRKT
jgi:hypothetical protein